MWQTPRVMRFLFVCVGNTCRSQMAEGIARSMGHEAVSAGTHPGATVASHALTILHEMDIDTSSMKPKSIDSIETSGFDYIISMGCGVSCPHLPIDEDWGLDDPVGQPLEVYNEVAATITEHLERLSHSS
jgi:arsenate reductase